MPHKTAFINFKWSLLGILKAQLIFYLLHFPNAQAQAQDIKDGKVTCDIPSVEPMAKASLKCRFPEDVSNTRKNFHVRFYKWGKDSNYQDVLSCSWPQIMSCSNWPGYNFNKSISHELTLEIQKASLENTGTYLCLLDGVNSSTPCTLETKLVNKTTCDIPSVKLKSQTRLTCYFPEDVSKNKRDIIVYHYTSSGSRDVVLSYKWKTGSAVTSSGYKLDGNVTNHLTLIIPNALKDKEGNYSCHVTSIDMDRSQNCTFTLEKVVSTSCSMPSVEETKPAELTCAFNVDVNKYRRNFIVARIGSKEIVRCTWVKQNLSCTEVALGYEFNETVTNQLVIRVPRASREHNGEYVCKLMDADVECFKPCKFYVVEASKSTGEHNSYSVIVTAVVSVASSFLLVLVLVIIRALRRRPCWENACAWFRTLLERKNTAGHNLIRTLPDPEDPPDHEDLPDPEDIPAPIPGHSPAPDPEDPFDHEDPPDSENPAAPEDPSDPEYLSHPIPGIMESVV